MGAVREDMAQMSVASVAMNFGPSHEKRPVLFLADHFVVDRLEERRPTGAAFKLCLLVEQWRTAADTLERTIFFRKIVVRAGPFGSVFSGDLVSQRRELRLPFGI